MKTLKDLRQAYDKTQGTQDYIKYSCESYSKSNGKWLFTGWSFPIEGIIKVVRGQTFVYAEDGKSRIRLSDNCKEFLGL